MNFLVDAQLPPALARMLRDLGHEAVHASALGLLTASDGEIWQAAVARNAAVITKDSDFVHLRAARRHGPQIVWLRAGNMSNAALLAICERSLPAAIAELTGGAPLVEIAVSA